MPLAGSWRIRIKLVSMRLIRSIKYSLILFFSCLFASSFAQVQMTIYNMCSVTLDSVVFSLYKPLKIGSVEKGSKKTIFINGDQAYFHSFAPFDISFYSSVLNTQIQWDKAGFVDTLYFFDHGISRSKTGPNRPKSYSLTIVNYSSRKIDSIFSKSNSINRIIEWTPKRFEVDINHEMIDLDNRIFIQIGKKLIVGSISGDDFNDWSKNSTSLFVKNDSAYLNWPEEEKETEYLLYFEIQDKINPNTIKILSKNLIKSYYNDNYIRSVFLYDEFMKKPSFQVKIGKKIHSINVEKQNLNETPNSQYFYVSKNGVLHY
jgi:hypothetical protein